MGIAPIAPNMCRSKRGLYTIPGTPPSSLSLPKGDAFACRNKYALRIDYEEEPPMFCISDTHYAATWLLEKRAAKLPGLYRRTEG